jgi:hypothetical protein
MDLSTEAYKAIKSNGELFGKIADALDVSPFTLPDKIRKNDPDLTRIEIIWLIEKYTGLTQEEILVDDKIMA